MSNDFSTIIDDYKRRLTNRGETPRDRTVEDAKIFFQKHALYSPAYKTIEVDGETQNVIMISTSEHNEKVLRSMPGEDFTVGKIAVCRGSHWLITSRDHDDDVTTRARIELCNRELVWQNPQTKEIVRRWCTASKPYYSNLSTSLEVNYSKREFKIQLPYDEETSQIKMDKRFILEYISGEPKAYKVTAVDTVTERYDRNGNIVGFLVLNITQDFFNPEVDNPDIGICNYIDPDMEVKDGAKITFIGDAVLNAGGSWKKFEFVEEGIDSADLDVTWDISFDSTFYDYIHIQEDGNTVRLRADDNVKLSNIVIYITGTENNTTHYSTIQVKVRCI